MKESIQAETVIVGNQLFLRTGGGRTWVDGQYFNIDHRAGPEEFVEGLNAVLEAQNSPLRFVLIFCGDDNYYFGLEKS